MGVIKPGRARRGITPCSGSPIGGLGPILRAVGLRALLGSRGPSHLRRGDSRRLVVLGGQHTLLKLVLGRVRLGGALDVHEGDGTRQRAPFGRGATPGARLAARQQLDTLDPAISEIQEKVPLVFRSYRA